MIFQDHSHSYICRFRLTINARATIAMPSIHVQDFIFQKSQGRDGERRMAIGRQLRVPVPSTKLEKALLGVAGNEIFRGTIAASPDSKTSTHRYQETIALNHDSHGDGFDTDAESFDDTLTVSSAADEKGRGQCSETERIASHTPPPSRYRDAFLDQQGSHRAERILRPIQAEDPPKGEDDGDSHENSGQEEDMAVVRPIQYDAYEATEKSCYTITGQRYSQDKGTPVRTLSPFGASSQKRVKPNIPEPIYATDCVKDTPLVPHPTNSEHLNFPSGWPQPLHSKNAQHHSISQDMEALQSISAHQKAFQDAKILSDSHGISTTEPGVTGDSNFLTKPAQRHASIEKTTGVSSETLSRVSVYREDLETSSEEAPPMTTKISSQARKSAFDLDYSPDQLSGMTFQQLLNEPFESNSKLLDGNIPPRIVEGSLCEKLDHAYDMEASGARKSRRQSFFSSLTIEQCEECGDLMLDKLSNIIAKYKDVRQQRRTIANAFEEQIAKREEHLRSKKTGLEKDLGRLKRAGKEVVKGS